MTVPSVSGIHHLTLTVTDIELSARWYQDLLGPATTVNREGSGWRRIRMSWPHGLIIGVTEFEGAVPAGRFDPTSVGLDHIGLCCASEESVRTWAERLDDLGIAHGPVEDVPYGWAVTARDPDGIAVEFFCPK